MRIPEPRQKPNGRWIVQVQVDGKRRAKEFDTKKAAQTWAASIKTEAAMEIDVSPEDTLEKVLKRFIDHRTAVLSPSTIRGYRTIAKSRFESVQKKPVDKIKNWQAVVNNESTLCSPKTLKNAFRFVRTAVKEETGITIPDCRLPAVRPNERPFLSPDQIPVFVAAIKETDVAIPALLALSSMRESEVLGVRWENVPENAKFIRVEETVVPDEHHKFVRKKTAKNATSTRNVPIVIPALREALEINRKPSGPVYDRSVSYLRNQINRVCEANNLPRTGVHGLRHSYASLAYHLRIPTKIAAEIGGWKNTATMDKIYTHIAQSDFERYSKDLGAYYGDKVAEDEEKDG